MSWLKKLFGRKEKAKKESESSSSIIGNNFGIVDPLNSFGTSLIDEKYSENDNEIDATKHSAHNQSSFENSSIEVENSYSSSIDSTSYDTGSSFDSSSSSSSDW